MYDMKPLSQTYLRHTVIHIFAKAVDKYFKKGEEIREVHLVHINISYKCYD